MRNVVHILSGICIVVLCILIANDLVGRFQTKSAYDWLEDQVTISVEAIEKGKNKEEIQNATENIMQKEGITKETNKQASEEVIPEWYKEKGIQVDFSRLKDFNEDIIGWIVVDGTDICYPVLQGETNDTYLRKNYEGKSCTAGSIFLENANQKDFSDYHMIVYGHNMRKGTMFGGLKNYCTDGFYKNHSFFTVYTPEKIMRFQIFSYHETDAYGSIYKVGFEPGDSYKEFLSEMVRASIYDTGVSVTEKDQVMTLSTCAAGEDRRFVVHGKCIEVIKNVY